MKKLKINKIDSDVVWELITKSWEMIRINYSLTVIMMLLILATIPLGMIPIFGIFATSIIGSLVPLAFYRVCAVWESGEKGEVSQIFDIYKDQTLLKTMMPLILLNMVMSGAPQVLGSIGINLGFFQFYSLPLTILIGAAYPILFFNHGKMDFVTAITTAIEGIGKNIVPFIVGCLLLMAVALVSLVALVLPFFFVALPMIFAYNYLWYRCVYEDLEMNVLEDGDI